MSRVLENPLLGEEKFVADVQAFLTPGLSQVRNAWFKCRYIDVYLRKTRRIFDDRVVMAIDVANVEVPEKYRMRGIFSAFLQMVETSRYAEATYIENVTFEEHVSLYRERGFTEEAIQKGDRPSFYKLNRPNVRLRNRMEAIRLSRVVRPPKVKKAITVNMEQATYDTLNAKAKANGNHSVSEYLLECAGMLKADPHEVQQLVAEALVAREFSDTGIQSSWTFQELFEIAEVTAHSAKVWAEAERLYRREAHAAGIQLIAKYPNRYFFVKKTKE